MLCRGKMKEKLCIKKNYVDFSFKFPFRSDVHSKHQRYIYCFDSLKDATALVIFKNYFFRNYDLLFLP